MQEIVADQIRAHLSVNETDVSNQAGGCNSSIDSKDMKARRKQRLNRLINSASIGHHAVYKPHIEPEEMA